MSFQTFYKKSFGPLFLLLLGFTMSVFAQESKAITDFISQQKKDLPVVAGNNLYCAGYISKAKVDEDYELVGAENEQEQFIYSQGNYLYISAGANKGLKVGDWFATKYGPFCSHRCTLIDLGKWFSGENSISEPLRPEHFAEYENLVENERLDRPENS